MNPFLETKIKAILLAFEVQATKCVKIRRRLKAVCNELSKYNEINTDSDYQHCNKLLCEMDTLKTSYASTCGDLEDFMLLIHHEFDLFEKPIKEGLLILENKIKEYTNNKNIMVTELNRRYRRNL